MSTQFFQLSQTEFVHHGLMNWMSMWIRKKNDDYATGPNSVGSFISWVHVWRVGIQKNYFEITRVTWTGWSRRICVTSVLRINYRVPISRWVWFNRLKVKYGYSESSSEKGGDWRKWWEFFDATLCQKDNNSWFTLCYLSRQTFLQSREQLYFRFHWDVWF